MSTCFRSSCSREQRVVVSVCYLHKVIMRTLLQYATTPEHHNLVCVADSCQSMSDNNGGALPTCQKVIQCSLNNALGHIVESARGLIKDQNTRVTEHCACDRDTLLLSATHGTSRLANKSIKAVRLLHDKVVCVCCLCGRFNFFHSWGSTLHGSIGDIVANACCKQYWFLAHQANAASKPFHVQVTEIVSIHFHSTFNGVVKPLEKSAHCAFPTTRATNTSHGGPGFDFEVQAFKHTNIWSCGVCKCHVLECKVAFHVFQLDTLVTGGVNQGLPVEDGIDLGGSGTAICEGRDSWSCLSKTHTTNH
mmetsp:Transcript_13712/g.24469  ORF Transcript_13712/g.24469 Transcript_13712/m.24469 type:complete len:306 (+) Transcript_13712:2059-2976(+)